MIVEVPDAARHRPARGAPRQAREELRLTVHRFLVQEAQRIHATVSPMSEHGFLVVATRARSAQAADGVGGPPFVERARSELGIGIEVGVGAGRTELEAEARARAALGRPAGDGPAARAVTGADRSAPGARPARAAPGNSPAAAAALDTLVRLAEKLTEDGRHARSSTPRRPGGCCR